MSLFWNRATMPATRAEEEALRRSLPLPALDCEAPDAARLNRIADEALRMLRRRSLPEPVFGWLLAPRVAVALLAFMVAGGAVGANWPEQQATSGGDVLAMLDTPAAIPGAPDTGNEPGLGLGQ
jgi:hypothetical protein